MKKISSTGISAGKALAPLVMIKSYASFTENSEFTTFDNEWNNFRKAQKQAINELNNLALRVKNEQGEEFAALFETHALMAEDPDFEDSVRVAIEQDGLTASAAAIKAGENLALIFESMDDEYMRERSADIKDVAHRIAAIICNAATELPSFSSPVIVAADDLTPSQTALLDKQYVKGFILYNGTRNGHTGILARNSGIPAVIKPNESVLESDCQKTVFIDGETGEIIIEPDEKTENDLKVRIENEKIMQNELLSYRDAPTRTSDGRSVKIFCNIVSPEDANDVIENGGEGVGLFRSEFLYLGRNDYPSEEEQFEAYAKTLKTLRDKEVIIRTCDIGADKKVDYFSLDDEQNPALGKRAIRLCLERKEMFKTQLRALLRASVYGNLSVMFPMITSPWELEEAKALIQEIKGELTTQKTPYDKNVKIGIMIETPAAAVISDKLAHIADFFSIGSNDLIQYTLACDRNSQLDRYYDPKHPAVLRLIETVTKNAHNAGIPVGICGELAADEELTEFFLNIGIDELSVSPKKVMSLRKKINNL